MIPSFFVCCVDGDGEQMKAHGPFETREEAIADLTVVQQRPLERCNENHHVVAAHKMAPDIPVYPPVTTVVERRQQMAREAATRSAR